MSNYALSATLALRDQFTATINKAKSKFGELDGTFKRNAKSFKDYQSKMKGNLDSFNSGIKKVELAALGMGGAVAAGLTSAYMGYVDLNEQLVRNKAITGASEAEFKALTDQVKKLGATTSFTAKQVAEAQMYQGMAGYDTNRILETTDKLLKLSIVAGEDLATTTDKMTDAMDALGLSTKDTGRYLDLLANMSNKSNTTVNMMQEAFLKGAGTAVSFGESIETVGTLLGLLASKGLKGSEAGTFINAFYAKLTNLNTDKRGKELLKTLNIDLYDKQTKKFKGLETILAELRPKFAKMTDEQKNFAVKTLAGVNHMDSFLKLLEVTPEQFEAMKNAANTSQGAMDKFYETLSTADRKTIDEMKSAFDGLKTQIGEALSPIVMENMKKLTQYMSDLGASDTFSTENMRSFFKTLQSEVENAITLFLGYKTVVLSVRAAMGDVTAIAALTAMGIAGLTYGFTNSPEGDSTPGKERAKQIAETDIQKKSYLKLNTPIQYAEESLKETKLGYNYNNAMAKFNAEEHNKRVNTENERKRVAAANENYRKQFGTVSPTINLTGPMTFNSGVDVDTLTTKLQDSFSTMIQGGY